MREEVNDLFYFVADGKTIYSRFFMSESFFPLLSILPVRNVTL